MKFKSLVSINPYNFAVCMTYMLHCVSATTAFLRDKLKILEIDDPINEISSSRGESKKFNLEEIKVLYPF